MKHDLRVAVTRRMVKDALIALMETRPLDKIKVSELCRQAGVNRATFYRHYNTPRDVLQEIAADFAAQIPRCTDIPRGMEEVRAAMEAVCQYIYDNVQTVKILFFNRSDADMMQAMEQFYRGLLQLREQERLGDMDDDTVRIVAALIGGGCQCLLRQWILEDIPKTPGEIAAILCNVIRWPSSAEFLME